MPQKPSDYVSEGGRVAFDPYAKPNIVEGLKFHEGEVDKNTSFGKEVPSSSLASDQAEFTGPVEPTFTKNAGKHSEDKGLNYNKGHDVGL